MNRGQNLKIPLQLKLELESIPKFCPIHGQVIGVNLKKETCTQPGCDSDLTLRCACGTPMLSSSRLVHWRKSCTHVVQKMAEQQQLIPLNNEQNEGVQNEEEEVEVNPPAGGKRRKATDKASAITRKRRRKETEQVLRSIHVTEAGIEQGLADLFNAHPELGVKAYKRAINEKASKLLPAFLHESILVAGERVTLDQAAVLLRCGHMTKELYCHVVQLQPKRWPTYEYVKDWLKEIPTPALEDVPCGLGCIVKSAADVIMSDLHVRRLEHEKEEHAKHSWQWFTSFPQSDVFGMFPHYVND
jgi:hypothetical protein